MVGLAQRYPVISLPDKLNAKAVWHSGSKTSEIIRGSGRMIPFRLTLHLLPTRRTKSDIAPSVRSVNPSFAFPTKLIFSSCQKSCNISVSRIRVAFVIVKAEVFPIVALDPCRSPRAPNARVCKWGSVEMIASKSALETLVDVRESFVSCIFGGLKSETGCCTSVNDKSKRCRLGHLAMMEWSEVSDKDV